jgi:hypothetical protein
MKASGLAETSELLSKTAEPGILVPFRTLYCRQMEGNKMQKNVDLTLVPTDVILRGL